ncbi:hypothetical protein L596_001753 [Steinernema carpocapsae]|uniref:Uncharacterized protein n=1 Tax=Steinernema carpocapsae TaxID=34508 RepID=A0A4U8UMN7_STECR|nr:hypothetical protein L596_001753 [Steinernema carpocapsae]
MAHRNLPSRPVSMSTAKPKRSQNELELLNLYADWIAEDYCVPEDRLRRLIKALKSQYLAHFLSSWERFDRVNFFIETQGLLFLVSGHGERRAARWNRLKKTGASAELK